MNGGHTEDTSGAVRERSRTPVPSDQEFQKRIADEEAAIAAKQIAAADTSDTEADEDAAPLGAGPRGIGDPLFAAWGDGHRVSVRGLNRQHLKNWASLWTSGQTDSQRTAVSQLTIFSWR